MVVSEITTGDHSKGTDGRQRPGLRTAQRVLATAVAHQFAIWSTRQVEVTRKRVSNVDGSIEGFPVAIGPARVVARIVPAVVSVRIARISWSLAKGSPVVIFGIAVLIGVARE